MTTLFMICACHSFEHQIHLHKEDDEPEIYLTIHLSTHRNFFKRLWYGLKYAFGYTSRYGAWDEFILKDEDKAKLLEFLIKENLNNAPTT